LPKISPDICQCLHNHLRKIMDRRTFLSWVSLGALASSLPVAIAACTPEKTATSSASPSTEAAAARPDGFAAVGSLKDLEKAGFIQNKTFAAGPLLIVRDPADAAKLIAVNSTCTHKGCAVDWSSASKEFTCACHGSKFKLDGSVVTGPADKPLAKFTVKAEGDSVLVKAA
jgi:cytochrome b6-f complex iron-sulfur subunit